MNTGVNLYMKNIKKKIKKIIFKIKQKKYKNKRFIY
jgi:hypothetical protein